MSGITVDTTGAVKKINVMKGFPRAVQHELERFGSNMVVPLRRSAMAMQASVKYRPKTGALARSVGKKVIRNGDEVNLVIGTGLGEAEASRMAQKYAMIQDRGGVTHPTVTKKMRGWAWYMFYKTKEDKFKGIALTKQSKLTVKIPASHWFTGPWEQGLATLGTNYLSDKNILHVAEVLSGGTNA